MVEHISPTLRSIGGGCYYHISTTVLQYEIGMIIVVIACPADKIHRTMNVAVLEVSAMTGYLGVLVGEHTHILHNRLVATIDSHRYAFENFQTVVIVVADGEVLEIKTGAVTQVEDRIADAVGLAMDDNAVTALTDERYIVARELYQRFTGLHLLSEVVLPVLDEDGLASGCSRGIGGIDGCNRSGQFFHGGYHEVVWRFLHCRFGRYIHRYLDSSVCFVAVVVLRSSGDYGECIGRVISQIPYREIECSSTAFSRYRIAADSGGYIVGYHAVEGQRYHCIIVVDGNALCCFHRRGSRILMGSGQLEPTQGLSFALRERERNRLTRLMVLYRDHEVIRVSLR